MMAFLANRLARDGLEVSLLTYENNDLMQELIPEVNHIKFSSSPPAVFAIRRIFQIISVRKVIKDSKPDVIISFLNYPNIIAIIASLGTPGSIIISERGDPSAFQSSLFYKFRDFVYNFADGYVFQTNGAKKYYNERIQAKATVIPNPIIDEIPAIWEGDRENIIVNVGRLEVIQKRQDILIEAFSRIAARYPDIKLVLLGGGVNEPEIRKMISDRNLENRVVLAGIVKDIYNAIGKARLFVLSSDYEGMPNALIEAMCLGLPCISTDYSPGGAAELIKNMENGLLVKAGSTEELAEAMDFMLANPQIAEMLGRQAAKICTDLNPDAIIKRWKTYINSFVMTKESR